MLHLAIIGIGNMGFAHAKCVWAGEISGCVLSALCDIDPARLALAKSTFPGVALYSSAEALFADKKADAVLIATPHPSHTRLAIAAMHRGLHVLSEKPADVIFSRAAEACIVAQEAHVLYAMMFNQRNHPVFQALHRLLKSGELGNIKRVSWTVTNWYRTQHYYDSGGWRGTWSGEGGGVLLNQAPHNLDMICMLFGMPQSIYAKCYEGKYHNISVEDEAILLLNYDGFSLTFAASTGESPGINRMEIAADHGKVVVENGKIFWTKLPVSEREICFTSAENWIVPQTEIREIPLIGEDTAHKGILQNFVNAVSDGEPLIADGKDGLNEIMLSNAAYLSAWLKQEITLPLCDDRFAAELQRRAAADQTQKPQTAAQTANGYNGRWYVQW